MGRRGARGGRRLSAGASIMQRVKGGGEVEGCPPCVWEGRTPRPPPQRAAGTYDLSPCCAPIVGGGGGDENGCERGVGGCRGGEQEDPASLKERRGKWRP